ncbi:MULTISPECIES: helix-turn-helix transcriptional regulator [Cryobacterium]|uniref:WYL domain-containing transcriptional regulator n=1 Tax=Cryobacterium zongtaii TaxID=1259217 RepID=A0A2S3ZIE7_9MICO|nr:MULTISPECIES: WYL domain-containing protein [Cryobacterium]ASD22135.1 DNA-binding transcriptional regulator [Cryobacterium sp. LW097]POH65429.1 WYL domain-containing transcriptional regulator [Cryobacterium zongtaii]POH67347.1 WYL domain-containing transcriptional regulator [Cryobacterium zongtaii]TFC45128.1 WYL domain-containing transcriptional regulator [Cryobacterium sp. TMN-39-2]TFC55707.1 WYL domain-containing transcriptional regulator [Cryobacterium sp. TMB3-1-2]
MTAAKPVAFGASDKLTFLLSLVPYLMDHDKVSVTAVADHFGVTPERVRDAVNLIAMSGVPGETRQYLHGDLFDIQWDEFETNDNIVLTHLVAIDDSPRFSAREAAALIAGLQYLSALPENGDRDAIATLMAKLTRSSTGAPSQLAVSRTDADVAISVIQAAVRAGTQVEFDYLNARGTDEHRCVDPLRIESVDSDWYLRGWCHLREAMRTFRLDRMSNLRSTDVPADAHDDGVLLPDTLFQGTADDLTVTIELPAAALELLADYGPVPHGPADDEGRSRAQVRVSHFHGLKRLVAGLSGVVTVVDPGLARQTVAEWAAAGAARYESPATAQSEPTAGATT